MFGQWNDGRRLWNCLSNFIQVRVLIDSRFGKDIIVKLGHEQHFITLGQAPNEDLEQEQINYILKNEYFMIDVDSRAPFKYGICLYICWGVMVLYGVGASLYTFTACLFCCENIEEMKNTNRARKSVTDSGKEFVERVVIPESPSPETEETERNDTFEEHDTFPRGLSINHQMILKTLLK